MGKNRSRARNPLKNSAIRRIQPWMPIAVILLTTACLLVMMLLGGMARVWAWYVLRVMLILPILGLIFLIDAVLYAIKRQRISKRIIITALGSLLFLAPRFVYPSLPYPASIDTTKPAATVRLPANVPLKTAWGGDTADVNYHVTIPGARWAYDFVVEPYFTNSPELTDYGCYGVPVVAPAAGIVTAAHDGDPDTPINSDDENPGNFVVIKLDETGTYLGIGHFQPGSVRVKSGERVEEGQEIARCGNSGNSAEPHIHIHHQRQELDIDSPVWFAEGLPLYFRDHDGPPIPEGGVRVENGKKIATGVTVQHIGEPE